MCMHSHLISAHCRQDGQYRPYTCLSRPHLSACVRGLRLNAVIEYHYPSSVDQHNIISCGIFITHYDCDIFGVSIARNVCPGL